MAIDSRSPPDAPEKIARIQLKRRTGFDYFVREGQVFMRRIAPGHQSPRPACRLLFQPEPGYRYFLDDDGDVSRIRLVEERRIEPPAVAPVLDLEHPALRRLLAERDASLGEPLELYGVAADAIEASPHPAARTRAEFVRRQCRGEVAAELFEQHRYSWGVPPFREQLVTADDFSRGFLLTFRDHTTSWSDDVQARDWFVGSAEAQFARRYELWSADEDDVDGAVGIDSPVCIDDRDGPYKQLLASLVADGSVAFLMSPVFTHEELTGALRQALAREHPPREVERLLRLHPAYRGPST